nr:hypothetical protein [Tanacetum cinerariifolium]
VLLNDAYKPGIGKVGDEVWIAHYDVRGALGGGEVAHDFPEMLQDVRVSPSQLRSMGVEFKEHYHLKVITGWGMHPLSLDDLHGLAVAPFGQDAKRADLFQKLVIWAEAVRASGIAGQLWVDGSFLTEKADPGDIDCILWNPRWVDPALNTPEAQDRLSRLFDHAH